MMVEVEKAMRFRKTSFYRARTAGVNRRHVEGRRANRRAEQVVVVRIQHILLHKNASLLDVSSMSVLILSWQTILFFMRKIRQTRDRFRTCIIGIALRVVR
jgi:type IV secretory pathway VirB3-like protein